MRGKSHKNILKVETGDVYQPVRLTYLIQDKQKLLDALKKLKCIEQDSSANVWTWRWKNECAELKFDSLDSTPAPSNEIVRLGTLNIKQDKLYIHLPSFKRACLAVPFFHRKLNQEVCRIQHADFINKLFTQGETLPRKLNELFNDAELNTSSHTRVAIYKQIENQCESSLTTEEALNLLTDVIKNEDKWDLPYVERYLFDFADEENPQVVFIAFYLFMRSRELVVINRATGQPHYQLADAANETIQHTFGFNTSDKEISPIFLRAQALFRGYLQHKTVNVFC